jgi:hypothetical protein
VRSSSVTTKLEARSTYIQDHLRQTTVSTPEKYVAGLTDFGPGRSKLAEGQKRSDLLQMMIASTVVNEAQR